MKSELFRIIWLTAILMVGLAIVEVAFTSRTLTCSGPIPYFPRGLGPTCKIVNIKVLREKWNRKSWKMDDPYPRLVGTLQDPGPSFSFFCFSCTKFIMARGVDILRDYCCNSHIVNAITRFFPHLTTGGGRVTCRATIEKRLQYNILYLGATCKQFSAASIPIAVSDWWCGLLGCLQSCSLSTQHSDLGLNRLRSYRYRS